MRVTAAPARGRVIGSTAVAVALARERAVEQAVGRLELGAEEHRAAVLADAGGEPEPGRRVEPRGWSKPFPIGETAKQPRSGISRGSPHNGDTRGRVYVRPYEVDIARAPATGAFAARVLRVTPLSGGLKIELSVPSLGSRMRADIDWERGTALGLSDGDNVFLSLRRARVFAPD